MATDSAIMAGIRRASSRAVAAGPMSTATTSRLPSPWTATTSAGAEEQRDAQQRRRDQPGEQRVGERLGRVGELVKDQPAPQQPADQPDQRDLEERPLEHGLRPRLGEPVRHQWWWGGTTPTSP